MLRCSVCDDETHSSGSAGNTVETQGLRGGAVEGVQLASQRIKRRTTRHTVTTAQGASVSSPARKEEGDARDKYLTADCSDGSGVQYRDKISMKNVDHVRQAQMIPFSCTQYKLDPTFFEPFYELFVECRSPAVLLGLCEAVTSLIHHGCFSSVLVLQCLQLLFSASVPVQTAAVQLIPTLARLRMADDHSVS